MFLVLGTLVSGTIFYSLQEGWSVVDAFYFSVTTLTTVGLGDLTPKTTIGKLFTVAYIFAGLSIILGFIDVVAKETLSHQTGRGGNEEVQEDAPAS
jgi:voltage-gated potassium channel